MRVKGNKAYRGSMTVPGYTAQGDDPAPANFLMLIRRKDYFVTTRVRVNPSIQLLRAKMSYKNGSLNNPIKPNTICWAVVLPLIIPQQSRSTTTWPANLRVGGLRQQTLTVPGSMQKSNARNQRLLRKKYPNPCPNSNGQKWQHRCRPQHLLLYPRSTLDNAR